MLTINRKRIGIAATVAALFAFAGTTWAADSSDPANRPGGAGNTTYQRIQNKAEGPLASMAGEQTRIRVGSGYGRTTSWARVTGDGYLQTRTCTKIYSNGSRDCDGWSYNNTSNGQMGSVWSWRGGASGTYIKSTTEVNMLGLTSTHYAKQYECTSYYHPKGGGSCDPAWNTKADKTRIKSFKHW